MRDSINSDRIGLGIQDHRTRKRLLQGPSLTLSKCIDLCKSSEATNLQFKMISGAPNEDVHVVKDKHPSPQVPERPRWKTEDMSILWQSTSFRKRQVSGVGSEMYKVKWQKSFRSNLHNSD